MMHAGIAGENGRVRRSVVLSFQRLELLCLLHPVLHLREFKTR